MANPKALALQDSLPLRLHGPVWSMTKTNKEIYCLSDTYTPSALVTLYGGDRLDLLRQMPPGAARLIVTSPPYNIGKKYEKRLVFERYLEQQAATLKESCRVLADDGSLCWQVGNHVATDGEIFPLDIYIYRTCEQPATPLRRP